MQIQELEFKIFQNLDELRECITKNFNVDEMEILDNEDIDDAFDDELAFFDGEFDYSVYYMTGRSGRVIVVETSKQSY